LRQVIDAGRSAGIPVALCGELAADPLALPLLLGLGLEELSMSPPSIPEVKQAISRCSLADCRRLAERALTLESHDAVRTLLRESGVCDVVHAAAIHGDDLGRKEA
jgi:phosphoenolpyruvate-protein kinase (PTS system EI component)